MIGYVYPLAYPTVKLGPVKISDENDKTRNGSDNYGCLILPTTAARSWIVRRYVPGSRPRVAWLPAKNIDYWQPTRHQ
jgi:hypothetical protein